ncbi:hypothetical protein pb186bvf_003832 [Paramecium bursaria]
MITLHLGLQSFVKQASPDDYQGLKSETSMNVPQILLQIQLDEIDEALSPLSLGRLPNQTYCCVFYTSDSRILGKIKESGPTQKKLGLRLGSSQQKLSQQSTMHFRGQSIDLVEDQLRGKRSHWEEIDLFNLFPPKGVHNNNNYMNFLLLYLQNKDNNRIRYKIKKIYLIF